MSPFPFLVPLPFSQPSGWSPATWLRKKSRARVRRVLEAVRLVRAFNVEAAASGLDAGAEVGADLRSTLSFLKGMEQALADSLEPEAA